MTLYLRRGFAASARHFICPGSGPLRSGSRFRQKCLFGRSVLERDDFSSNRHPAPTSWIAAGASESTGRPRAIVARPGSLPRPSPRQDFLLRSGNETLALRLLARELTLSSDRLRLFPVGPLGRLLIEAPPFHLAEDAFALHLLLQDPKRLVDVVVADENLQGMLPSLAGAGGRTRAGVTALATSAKRSVKRVPATGEPAAGAHAPCQYIRDQGAVIDRRG